MLGLGSPAAERAAVWRGRAMVVLAGLGVLVSGYLTWVHYGGTLALCTGAGGCEQVQASRFAVIAGIPIALLGLGLYLALFALSLWRVLARGGAPPPVPLALFGLALAGTLYSGYLTYLELFVIRAICPWCVSSAILLATLCVLGAWDVVVATSERG